MAGVNRRKCCCNGCASGACDFTDVTCPNVRVVFAGTTTSCCPDTFGLNSFDAVASTFDGTYALSRNTLTTCAWIITGNTIGMRQWSSASCTGTSSTSGYSVSVSFQQKLSGAWFILVAFSAWFAGEIAVGSCSHGPITVTNGTATASDGTTPLSGYCTGGGGTATVTFCV